MLSWIAVGLAAVQAAAPHVCGDHVCVDRDDILVIASSEEEAERAHGALIIGRERFALAMGVMPGRTALILDPDTRPDALPGVEAAGFDTVVVWMSPARMAEIAAPRLREAMAAQMEGAPAPVIDALVSQLVGAQSETAFDILAHEAGHFWFMDGWDWPQPVLSLDHYGVASVPDWLDELAAVAAEGDAMTRGRRDRLCQLRPDPVSGAYLASYFDATHPQFTPYDPDAEIEGDAMFEVGGRMGDALGGGAVPMTLSITTTTSDREGAAEPGEIFYELARGLLDYAHARSGGAPLWGDLAGEIAGGGDFDAWLSRRGPDYGLPGDVNALAADFSAWLDGACAPD